jgi:hypothetical protein
MRTIIALAAVTALSLSALPLQAKTPPSSKSSASSIVIVFKDGHRQSFNLADIARVEFAGASESLGGANPDWPARGQFVGRWVVGVGSGSDDTFVITLKEDGSATRSLHALHGRWTYVNGEARVVWDDGAQDAIRRVGSGFEKYAYSSGKSFTDEPDNVTQAKNTTPKPI